MGTSPFGPVPPRRLRRLLGLPLQEEEVDLSSLEVQEVEIQHPRQPRVHLQRAQEEERPQVRR